MSEPSRVEEAALPVSRVQRIDAACLQFEKAWKMGQRPRIEDYLVDTTEPERALLLRELIALDVDYRRQAGEQPQAEEYQVRFSSLDTAEFGKMSETPEATLACSAPRPTVKAPQIPGYEILTELGRGGMGVIYKAWQTDLRRLVARKMIVAGQLASLADVQRFRREAQTTANLQHPNIVAIHEIGEHDGQHHFSMDYVDGGTLAQKVNGTPQPPRYAAQLEETLARAVYVAHQRGIVHRDLKPENVLLTAEGDPKISDFGLAKPVEGGPRA
jgi:hypothetical protein